MEQGRDETELRFIQADAPEATTARLALVQATATVIASGLLTMGVTPQRKCGDGSARGRPVVAAQG